MSDFKFSCPNCGQHISATEAWSGRQIQCPSCQQHIAVPGAPVAAPPPAVRLSGAAPAAVAPPVAPDRSAAGPAGPGPAARGKTSGLAIAALVCGILTFLGCSLLAALPAVICGHLALSRLKSGRATAGRGLAIAGLILGYVGIVASIVVAIFWGLFVTHRVKQVQAEMQKGRGTMRQPGFPNARPVRPGPRGGLPPGAISAEDRSPANEPRVATDPAAVRMPEAPATGVIHGEAFTCEQATLQNGILELKEGKALNSERQVTLFLFPKGGERLAGKKYAVSANSTGMNPHVLLRWPNGNSSQTDNYCLRLEFGEIRNGKVPGKIYLELSEPRQTRIAGTFTAATK
jgi:hypothetical protein